MSAVEQLILRGDGLELALLPELGARIHRLQVDGVDLLRTPDDAGAHRHDPFFWGAYVMAPWCNRASAEPFDVAGRTVRVRANFGDGSAIHGLVYGRPWEARDGGELRVTVDEGEGGWPWAFEVTARPAVDGRTILLAYEVVNRSNAPMPAGIGIHPWFLAPVVVAVPAEAVYPLNSASPPVPSPVDAAFDLRHPATPARGVDATWTNLTAPAIELAWPQLGLGATIEVEASRVCVAVAAPEGLGAVAIEPQTHGPDGLRRVAQDEPDAPRLLDPGASMRFALRLAFTGAASRP